MKQTNDFMKTRPVFGLLMSMSVPMMISMLIQSLYNIVDSIYIAKLGTQALTAVSLAFPLQNTVLSVAVGIGVGISTAISIHLGAGNQKQADRAATLGIALSVIHCLLFIVFGLLVTRPFLRLFTNDPQTLLWSCQYTYIVLCASFGCIMQIAMEKVFQSVGSMKTTMILLIIGCLINIILDPILIFGLLWAPALGIIGAAIATVTGQIASFLLYILVYWKRRHTFPVKIQMSSLHMDRSIIRQIYSVGIPSSIMIVLPSILVSILNGLLAAFSEIYVAVFGVYYKLQTFIYLPASGIVQGMRPVIGYNYGAGSYDRVKKTIRYSLMTAAVLMLMGTVASLVFPAQIFALFDAEPELLAAGIQALRIICLGFLISSIGLIYAGTFESFGMGKQSLIISLLRQFIITIPLSFFLSRIWGPVGVWIAFPVSELCASIAAFFMLRQFKDGMFSPF